MCAARNISYLNKQGMNALSDGNYMNAEFLLRQALQYAVGLDAKVLIAKIYNNLGLLYVVQCRHDKANRCFIIAKDLVADRVGTKNTLYDRICKNLRMADESAMTPGA